MTPAPLPPEPSRAERPTWRRGLAVVARWAPFVVPVVYFLIILSLQPSGHMGTQPDAAPWLHRTVYDDYDMTAMALRGLNAHLGRTPGRRNNPQLLVPDGKDETPDDAYEKALHEDRPLQPRYYLEYPHADLLLFRVGWLLQPDAGPFPAALCDGAYGHVVEHWPRDDGERALWRAFRRTIQIEIAIMLACGLGLAAVLRAGYERGGGLASSGLLLLLPATLYFTLNRFDVVPALLTALSLACLGRRWPAAAAVFLGAATMIKIYPLLLAPLVLRYLWGDFRRMAVWAGWYAATLAAFALPTLCLYDWDALWGPYAVQLSRDDHFLTLYGSILPARLADNDLTGRVFRFGVLGLTVGLLCLRRPPDLTSLLRRGAVVVMVFMALSVFFSPQWLVWLAPLLAPAARGRRGLTGLLVALDLTTYFTWPAYSPLWPSWEWTVYARCIDLAALLVVLLWEEWRAKPQVHPGAASLAVP